MNRDFVSNFDSSFKKKQEHKPEPFEPDESKDVEYSGHEYIRNLYLVWPEGKRVFFAYNRLDSGYINEDQTSLRLMFGSDIVELTGIKLLPLLNSISTHKRKYVYCDDARYNHLNDDDEPIVNDIVISQAK